MKRRRLVAATCLAALCLVGADRPGGLGDVVDVRHWSYPDYTRVVVELSRPAEQSATRRLAADPAAQRPERLYLDLEGVWVGRRYLDGIPVSDGLLQGVRLGQNTLTVTRVVLDLERYDRHRLLTLTHPDRVVIDVYGRRDHAETLRWPQRDTPDEETPARLPADMRPVRTVVLDPGHGGRDAGAIGVGGLREKDVALRLAKVLGARLEKRGFRVVYTREDDRTLDLEERTAIAEGSRGDVFVSLHLNASRRRAVDGIETYYLDRDHDRHSLNMAARENGVERHQVDALQRLLAKLHIEEVSPHSKRLATLVQQQILKGIPKRYRPLRDLGVKKGPFYVLFLSNMPAILIEAGFLTNSTEARRLRDHEYLAVLAEQIAIGLDRYREGGATLALREAR